MIVVLYVGDENEKKKSFARGSEADSTEATLSREDADAWHY